jgi:hypothetical protein
MTEKTNVKWKPDPHICARKASRRVQIAVKALEKANQGKYAERVGVSARTMDRPNTK